MMAVDRRSTIAYAVSGSSNRIVEFGPCLFANWSDDRQTNGAGSVAFD
jgi:hypothetical protein